MDPIAKKILNALRCPICGGQIDLVAWDAPKKKSSGSNFCCVSDPEHYGIWLVHWEQPVRLENDKVVVYDGSYKHTVMQQYVPTKGFTTIQTVKVDPEHRVLDGTHTRFFSYHKLLFDYTKTTKEKLLNKIKTILVFQ